MIIVKYTEDGKRITFRPEEIQEDLMGRVGAGELTLEEGIKQLWFIFDCDRRYTDKGWFHDVAEATFGPSSELYDIIIKL